MNREKTTFYFVTVIYNGRRHYAVRGRVPTVFEKPEPRGLFRKERDAKELKRFLERESTFNKITLESVSV